MRRIAHFITSSCMHQPVKEQDLHELAEHRPRKPRATGMTHAVDLLSVSVGQDLPFVFDFVDVVKIGWGLPVLLRPDELKRRVAWYSGHKVEVSTGGSLTEYALLKDRWPTYLDGVRRAGFDFVEVSESRIALSPGAKRRLLADAAKAGLRAAVKVGRKNPKEQLSLRDLQAKLAEAVALEPELVVVEAGEGLGVTLFDSAGELRGEVLQAIEETATGVPVVYEAPQRRQRGALIVRLGSDVNLGGVPLLEVPELETQRLGIMSGETFGLGLKAGDVAGSPAVKFVHYLVAAHGPIGQDGLIRMSGLPRRTVQAALETLRRGRHVAEEPDLADLRRKQYRRA
jgi:phosphosulfolactate synthase